MDFINIEIFFWNVELPLLPTIINFVPEISIKSEKNNFKMKRNHNGLYIAV